MSHSARTFNLSVEDYLKYEEVAETRSEYVNGQIYGMVGATSAHNLIAGNLYALLHAHLKGGNCRVYMSDMKLRVESSNCFYYPDVMVTCESIAKSSVYVKAPVLIAEIMSPSTKDIDQREKQISYATVPGLVEYLVIHQDEIRIDVYRKNLDGQFAKTQIQANQDIELKSLPCPLLLSINELYDGIDH